ncbi:SOUL heme-binding protein [Mycolicibacterium chubuense NBB4]|uniref:SOUL heme-binding protein n=1 Tax=Mycolicibacterium chubuense (strain NBB4) TaxID=710421 RepID=I4BF84_MYCCN|nr:heme-binding protein [Mycolicibacterium chubuense]AFM15941.1 SOUL heme-binding protein [Mycolicibacterium chubuense NBB4]
MLDIKEVVSQGLGFAGSIVGIRWGTEEPRYVVVDTIRDEDGDVEIRRYDARVAAETTVDADEDAARNVGFRRLAGYIFGGNSGGAKIDMTAPVTQRTGGQKIAMTAPVAQQQSTIRFFMPAKWTLDTLPQPNDGRVRLVEVPGETVAVLKFSGDRSPAEVERRTQVLRRILSGSAHQPAGDAVAWFYDPPFTLPFRRRNEVVIPVEG